MSDFEIVGKSEDESASYRETLPEQKEPVDASLSFDQILSFLSTNPAVIPTLSQMNRRPGMQKRRICILADAL